MLIKGNIIDLFQRRIFKGEVYLKNGRVVKIEEKDVASERYILPGFIDSHVHIESSMLVPSEFGRIAVQHGTVSTVSDPHEIANVLGVDGIEFMIDNARKTALKIYFGAPSCVPATSFESSGAKVGLSELEDLMARDSIKFLGEMMNYPGVIFEDEEVLKRIDIAKRNSKPVDGHIPGVSGLDLVKYIKSGVSTDHECSTIEEAREKIDYGMKILIREGSAARNMEALAPLLAEHPEKVMLCSDDIHPEMLLEGHINSLVVRLIDQGYDLFDILRATSVNPVEHYNLDVGLLREGDPADFIVINNLSDFKPAETWIDGKLVYKDGRGMEDHTVVARLNSFNSSPLVIGDIRVTNMQKNVRVIGITDGELYTKSLSRCWSQEKYLESSTEHDILKLVVKERYRDLGAAVGFIEGFGLKRGAIASSVAHDSHNILAVGADDRSIAAAINSVIEARGGLAISDGDSVDILPLPVGGIMSDVPCGTIAAKYLELSEKVKVMGSHLKSPFMTLSFMALLVIPELKLGDRGLFDGKEFRFTDLFID